MDAKDAIKAQFMKEYARKKFDEITVKALCAATPVARTTFYSYFNNTDEVKEQIEDELIGGLLAVAENVSSGNYPDMDFSIFMDETEKYIKEHWTEIYAFLIRQPNLRFMRKWKDAIKLNFRRRYPEKQRIKNYEAVAEILASSMISAYTYWMDNPDAISTAQIKPLMHKVLDSLISLIYRPFVPLADGKGRRSAPHRAWSARRDRTYCYLAFLSLPRKMHLCAGDE